MEAHSNQGPPLGIGSAEGWGTVLRALSAASEEEPQRLHYIVREGDGYRISTNPENRLHVSQIVQKSVEAAEILWRNRDNIRTAENQIGDIFNETNVIINHRVEKRENNNRLNKLRRIARWSSCLLIGLPLYLKIKAEDRRFNREIREMRDHLSFNHLMTQR